MSIRFGMKNALTTASNKSKQIDEDFSVSEAGLKLKPPTG